MHRPQWLPKHTELSQTTSALAFQLTIHFTKQIILTTKGTTCYITLVPPKPMFDPSHGKADPNKNKLTKKKVKQHIKQITEKRRQGSTVSHKTQREFRHPQTVHGQNAHTRTKSSLHHPTKIRNHNTSPTIREEKGSISE